MVLQQGSNGIMVKISKKGNISNYSDRRVFHTFTCCHKAFTKNKLPRIRDAADSKLREEKASQRYKDQIFALWMIWEEFTEKPLTLYMNFRL